MLLVKMHLVPIFGVSGDDLFTPYSDEGRRDLLVLLCNAQFLLPPIQRVKEKLACGRTALGHNQSIYHRACGRSIQSGKAFGKEGDLSHPLQTGCLAPLRGICRYPIPQIPHIHVKLFWISSGHPGLKPYSIASEDFIILQWKDITLVTGSVIYLFLDEFDRCRHIPIAQIFFADVLNRGFKVFALWFLFLQLGGRVEKEIHAFGKVAERHFDSVIV